ncbi:cytochrome-c oxidase, cbb3-type subunit II [Oricola cellulosilytica]|uniref:Cytochrome-c oxidase, cbb3-type subunit II n=1 Tax=Oricola cellulosilytica TaxID=1429082 RepID=A0A4R0PBV5_9HYPH|nr:cytochrome-c oxidase, cbb3-type subunit II [Oricola cellulosilytica]TCD14940.1 cytochrome-c oxidase, cbb3-type subunit II [Oricola cellulosilytica]
MSDKKQDPALEGALPELKADPVSRTILANHGKIERNVTLLLALSLAVVSVGGVVEIAPLFYLENTIEKVEGMRPYSPLELAGRNIYVREGCYVCHSQMIRPFRDEVERYGHYSLAAESMYDHPFQWGSKRTGPDLARVGGRYSNEWHVEHLINPQAVVPESIMPSYAFLATTEVSAGDYSAHLVANRRVGVPYTDEMIENATADLVAQADPNADTSGVEERYPKAVLGDFDGDPARVTEMDALVAYLQMMGTLVDFSVYEPEQNYR